MAIVRIQELFQDKDREGFTFIFFRDTETGGGNISKAPVPVHVDATVEETYELTSTITDNEIQDGSTLVDHIHTLPERVVVRCIISEAPVLFLPTVTRDVIQAGFSLVSGATRNTLLGRSIRPILGAIEKYAPFIPTPAGAITNLLFGEAIRHDVQRTYWKNFLKSAFEAKQPFKIQSGVEVIENVFFESISFNRDHSLGDSLEFTASLKEIRYIQSNVVRTDASPYSHNLVNRGRQSLVSIGGSIVEDVTGVGLEDLYPRLPLGHITKVEDAVRTGVNKGKSLASRAIKGILGLF